MLLTTLLVLHITMALLLIALVLVQKGSTRTIGMGGASQTLFGSQGSGSFMTRLTGVVTGLFFASSLGLRALSPNEAMDEMGALPAPPQSEAMQSQNK